MKQRMQLYYVLAGIGGYLLVALWNIRYFFYYVPGSNLRYGQGYSLQEQITLVSSKLINSLWPAGALIIPLMIIFHYSYRSILEPSKARANTIHSILTASIFVMLYYTIPVLIYGIGLEAYAYFGLMIAELIAIPIATIIMRSLLKHLLIR